MRKLISFMHVSLDGFVAGPNGELDWVKVNEELFTYVEKRISESNTAMYGRNTYQMMESYWPKAGEKPNASRHDIEHSAWYNKAHKIVLSKTLKEADLKNTTVINGDLSGKINAIKRSPDGGNKEILVFGSPTATHALIQENLIDGYWLFVNPVILGKGIPLFKDIKNKIDLKLLDTKRFSSGVIEVNYGVL